jgi:peptide/nickel transport system ATP-binding protein
MRQRVLIALSLLLDPQVIILDEPTTALDILTQRAVIDTLRGLRDQLEFSLIFISHDLALAAELADRVATMYAGAVIEIGNVFEIFEQPRHPYTEGLIHAVPTVTGELEQLFSIPGQPPDLIELIPGCKVAPRCQYVEDRCRSEEPALQPIAPGHLAACFNWERVGAEKHG